jgi:hypothetical protein
MFNFGGYVHTMLVIGDIHFIFHNFFILSVMYVLDSGRILCFCLCILTILTMYIFIRSLQGSLFIDRIIYVSLRMDLYFQYSILDLDIFIVSFGLFIGLPWAFSTYIIGLIFLAYY